MALKTLRCYGNASLPEQRSALRAISTLNPPMKYIRKLGGLSPIHSRHRHGAQGFVWGAWGPFLPAAAMVVAVVMPVVFCAMATEKCNEITKTGFLLTIILSITICCKTFCSSRTANCSMARAQVGAQPEPKPLWSNGPQHIGYRRKALVIVRTILTLYWGQKVGIMKKTRTSCTQCTIPMTANYLRFLAFLVSGSYAPVVLMPDLSSLLGCRFWTRLLGSWKHVSRSQYVLIRKLWEIKVWFLYLNESSKEWRYMCVSCRILHDPVVFDTCYWWTHVPLVLCGCARRRVYVRGSLVIGLVWVPIQVLLCTQWYLSTL